MLGSVFMICENCGAAIKNSDVKCPNCGEELNETFFNCAECGAKVSESDTKCPKCGTSFINEAQSDNEDDDKLLEVKRKIDEYVAQHCNVLLFLVEVSVIILLIMWFVVRRDNRLSIYLPVVVLLLIGLAISGISGAQYKKIEPNKKCYCTKCKKETYHNKFRVCTACNSDFMAVIPTAAAYYTTALLGMFLILSKLVFGNGVDWMIILLIAIMTLALFKRVYLYPSILARRTAHTAATVIFILNIAFGFTGIMWLILTIWASSGGNNKTVVTLNPDGTNVTVNNISKPEKQSESMQTKFEELKKLHEIGMVSDEEFEQKRKEFISRL